MPRHRRRRNLLRRRRTRGYLRRRRRGRLRRAHRGDEPVPPPLQRLDEARVVGLVPQRHAQPVDGAVQPAVEVDEGLVGPEPLPERLARHGRAARVEQGLQDPQRLLLQTHPQALPPELAGTPVQLENAEPEDARSGIPQAHGIRKARA